ncbi:hypothetical protein OAD42_06315 [Oceanospirillaceae bacterium]|nr:hypothetical protein [Oceanospirillaceae bacterium]
MRAYGFLLLAVFSQTSWSLDVSAWSDKTLCRVAKEQPENEDFKSAIDARGLSCIVAVSKAKSQGVIAGEYNTRLLPQYHKYKNIIKTPLRGLKVPSGFTLVDDYTSFMNWHSKNTYDNMRDTEFEIGYQSQFVDPDVCVDDLISTITYKSLFNNVSGESDQITTVAAKCHQMTSQRFSNNPKTGIIAYKRVLTSWLNEGTLKKANKYRRRYDQPYDYALRHSVSNIMTHYAVYHRSYKFTPAKHADIVSMFEQWITTYKAYPGNDRMDGSLNVCDLKNPHTGHKRMHFDSNRRINQDHCGSINTRMAVSGIYFGLEFDSQVILDSGIRYTEMFMAIMDKNKMYSSQISRGLCAMSYADQMSPIIDQLDYALNKAYDIDFVNLKNIHGVTLAEVWYKLYDVAKDPKQLLPYHNPRQTGDCQPNLTGGKSLTTLIEEKNKRAIWGAFHPETYILRSPKIASTLRPKLWNTYNSDSFSALLGGAFAAGNTAVGISPLVLRKATGWKANPDLYTPSDFLNISSGSKKRIAKLMANTMKMEVSLEDFLNNVTKIDEKTSKSELYRSYRLDWFIINISSSGGYRKGATDYVTINGDGMIFDKVDRSKFPTPDLRKKLVFTMIGDGNFTLKGPLGKFDLEGRSYPTTIFGNIHQKLGLGIWQEGDPILVRLTKQ